MLAWVAAVCYHVFFNQGRCLAGNGIEGHEAWLGEAIPTMLPALWFQRFAARFS